MPPPLRSTIAVQPRLAIFGAEDNMNDDLAKRLRHCGIIAEKHAQVNRAVSASEFFYKNPGALPQASINIAPLAPNRYPNAIHPEPFIIVRNSIRN